MIRFTVLILSLVCGAARAAETCEQAVVRQGQVQAERMWSLVLEARKENAALEAHVRSTKPGPAWADVTRFIALEKKCRRECSAEERASSEKLREAAERVRKEHAQLLETKPPASLGVYKSPDGIWACPSGAPSFDEKGRPKCEGLNHVFAHQLEPNPDLLGHVNAITRGLPAHATHYFGLVEATFVQFLNAETGARGVNMVLLRYRVSKSGEVESFSELDADSTQDRVRDRFYSSFLGTAVRTFCKAKK